MGTVIIKFTDTESELIKQAAQKDYRSINQWCKLVLLQHAETSPLQPKEDIIVQRRNRLGRFEKKSP